MIREIFIPSHNIQQNTVCTFGDLKNLAEFPILTIDVDSYIVSAQVHTGIDLNVVSGCHCIAVGKGSSLSDSIAFLVDMNHNYGAVLQGTGSFRQGLKLPRTVVRKGSVIIQNDVWVGHGATIMSGVTLHNGCVVAANAVVTKDVPPYAIVGGNPAKIIRYRFDEGTISGMQKIAWWDWPQETLQNRKEDFLLSPPEFVKKYLPEAETKLECVEPFQLSSEKQVVLFIPDIDEPFPLYEKILGQFFAKDRPNVELLIYLSAGNSTHENLMALETILQEYEERDSYVTMQTGENLNEHMLFQAADYFVTTRCRETVWRTCLADLYGVKILYGTDEPMFPIELE